MFKLTDAKTILPVGDIDPSPEIYQSKNACNSFLGSFNIFVDINLFLEPHPQLFLMNSLNSLL